MASLRRLHPEANGAGAVVSGVHRDTGVICSACGLESNLTLLNGISALDPDHNRNRPEG